MTTVGIHQQYQGQDDLTTPAETVARYPHTAATREFTAKPIDPQNLVPKVIKLCQPVWDQGLIAVWSFKPKREAVVNGKWKPYIQQLVSHLNAIGRSEHTIICIWHEPENDMAAEEFTTMFNTIHSWIKATNFKVLTMHAALGYRYRDNGEIDDDEAERWHTLADMHAIDLYSGRSFPLDMTFADSTAFKRWHTGVARGGHWSASERGWTTTTSFARRAESIRREADWLATDPVGKLCEMVLIWDTAGTEGDKGLKIRDTLGIQAIQYYMDRLNPEPEAPAEPATETSTKTCPTCEGTGKITITKAL